MGISLLERPGEGLRVLADGPEARLSAAMGLLNAVTAEVVGPSPPRSESHAFRRRLPPSRQAAAGSRAGVGHRPPLRSGQAL
ncbi:MAG: hypothetical protein M3P53_09965, partial [Actinomycetota bacterium]|nr:hypothetical protein [Actinomycetota bacterium]